MKLGDVLKKEREKKGLSTAEVAEKLGIKEKEYEELEAGESPAEEWGPHLAQIAIELETPTSRLLAESGRFEDTEKGQAGELIKGHRERREKTEAEMAEALGISEDEYKKVEGGKSPIETYGPLLLGFAEAIEQPVFNLFYPCGLPFQELDDYP
ncbi:MAG: helix-turn-helix transcriptional regulator [Acidobacteriota bacterium]|jgi:transcriptional regulator with XRE-family HTH domain